MTQQRSRISIEDIEIVQLFKMVLQESDEESIFESFMCVTYLKFLLPIKKDQFTFPHTEHFKKVWDIYLICCFKKGINFNDLFGHFFKIPLQGTYSYPPLDSAVRKFYEMDEDGNSYLV